MALSYCRLLLLFASYALYSLLSQRLDNESLAIVLISAQRPMILCGAQKFYSWNRHIDW
jgi:hypothetical protein